MKPKILLLTLFSLLAIQACNKDEQIMVDNPQPPSIELDSETAVYVVKVGREFTIAPTYENAEEAIYSWKLNGAIISTEASLTYRFNELKNIYEGVDEHFITLEVTTRHGSASDEMRVDVCALAPPVISLVVPPTGLEVVAGRAYELTPDIQNSEDATFRWTMNGEEVSTEKSYTFLVQELGTYELSLYVENEDGQATKNFKIKAVDKIPLQIVFPAPMFGLYDDEVVKYVPQGRTIYLRPYIFNSNSPTYRWYLDEVALPGATNLMYAFKPTQKGTYKLSLTVTDTEPAAQAARITRNVKSAAQTQTTINLKIVCCDKEGSNYRPSNGSSSYKARSVKELLVAPGQFVNEWSDLYTMDAAIAFAEDCLEKATYVSLGGFGGYIVVDFDHSIDNTGAEYDFAVLGNQFPGSSEPGIVWVSQDTNNNGLPDDEWYELKAAEYGLDCTKQYYAVTYYRPEGIRMDTPWKDSYGKTGYIDYLIEYHKQPYYYPNWVASDSYTLFGSCLEARNFNDPDKAKENGAPQFWTNPSYDWGYVDNCGSDQIGSAGWVGFKIANAVNLDGSPANLGYVDFVKVVNALNTKSGWLGEVSTEVFGFNDMKLNKLGE